MLSTAAFNAFLKTLEEPPAYVKFILATTEKHKILPTILSRCQIFDFKRIKTSDIVSHLEYVASEENIVFEKAALEIIGQKADGSLRDALSIFDQAVNFSDGNITYDHIIENLNIIDFKYFFTMIKALNEGDIAQALVLFNEITDKGFDGQRFLESICEHIRNLMATKLGVINILDSGENITQLYMEQAKQLDSSFMLDCLDIFNRCDTAYKNANNKRLHVEIALMMCAKKKISPVKNNVEINTTKPAAEPLKETKNLQTETTPTFLEQNSITSFTRQPKQEPVYGQTVNIKSFLAKESKPNDYSTTSQNQEATKVSATPYSDEIEDNEEMIAEECKTIESDPVDKLTQHWIKYVEKATPNSITARMLLNEQLPLIKEENLYFEVANSIAEKEVKDAMLSLLQVIQTETGVKYSYSIQINHAKKMEAKIIIPEEKFKKMNDTNPALLSLKQKLNLSII
jgi:DNA polymerase III subunit gamma/tau